jgi:thiamine kinase-like enzyme
MTEQRVDAPRPRSVLSGMSFLAGEADDYRLTRLVGGLTNRNYRVSASGKDYVARFSDAKSALLAIDRDAEADNSRIAASVGVGPEVVEYAPDRNVLVVKWLDARTLTEHELDDAALLTRVAATCRRLHAGPRFRSDFDMFDVQRDYLRIVRENGFRLPDGYLDFEPQVHALGALLHATAPSTVACHNDLLAANMMDDGSAIWFIDFEYSGNNDPCFELGNIWSEADLPGDRLDHLVTSYFGAHSVVNTARAHLFGLMSKYGWTLWASIQDAVSDVDFDFWQWGMEKYVRAVAEFRSSSFDRLIDTVRDAAQRPGKPQTQGSQSWPTH